MTTAIEVPVPEKIRREPAKAKRVYIGSYMPFAGVRYYALFDDADVVLGRTHIGPVGWRRKAELPYEDDKREPVAA